MGEFQIRGKFAMLEQRLRQLEEKVDHLELLKGRQENLEGIIEDVINHLGVICRTQKHTNAMLQDVVGGKGVTYGKGEA